MQRENVRLQAELTTAQRVIGVQGKLSALLEQFKTLKYRPEFPERFGSLEEARAFCRTFFQWYNHQHRHGEIGYHTPTTVHHGQAEQVKLQQARSSRRPTPCIRSASSATFPMLPALPRPAFINPPEEVLPTP